MAKDKKAGMSAAEAAVSAREKVEATKTEAAKAEATEKVGKSVVAEGRSVTSLRGLLGPGTVVSPEDFAGGRDALKALVDNGAVVVAK